MAKKKRSLWLHVGHDVQIVALDQFVCVLECLTCQMAVATEDKDVGVAWAKEEP